MTGSTRIRKAKFSGLKSITVNSTEIDLVSKTKNLGVIFDEALSMEEQIKSVIKSCTFFLYEIRCIKKYTDRNTVKMLVYNLVNTRIDFCNSVYAGLPDYLLRKLQVTLNKGARLIYGVSYLDRITPYLIKLHWLPVKARVKFKICCLAYTALRYVQPAYLRNL